MTDQLQRVERAIRLTPRVDRGRYAAEWRADLAAAEGHEDEKAEVARAATRMALRLQARRVERILLGTAGRVQAVAGWAALLALLVAAGVLGGPVLLLAALTLVAVFVVLAYAGTPSRWTHWLVIVSLVTAAGSLGYVFWAIGASVDADDNFTTAPRAAGYAGAGILVFLASIVVLIGSAARASARQSRARSTLR